MLSEVRGGWLPITRIVIWTTAYQTPNNHALCYLMMELSSYVNRVWQPEYYSERAMIAYAVAEPQSLCYVKQLSADSNSCFRYLQPASQMKDHNS